MLIIIILTVWQILQFTKICMLHNSVLWTNTFYEKDKNLNGKEFKNLNGKKFMEKSLSNGKIQKVSLFVKRSFLFPVKTKGMKRYGEYENDRLRKRRRSGRTDGDSDSDHDSVEECKKFFLVSLIKTVFLPNCLILGHIKLSLSICMDEWEGWVQNNKGNTFSSFVQQEGTVIVHSFYLKLNTGL